jgi:hypothetical protein
MLAVVSGGFAGTPGAVGWSGNVIEASGGPTLRDGGAAVVNSVSCATAGNCAAVS